MSKNLSFPNILTSTRLLFSPIIGYCLSSNLYKPALALTVINGATDFIDGWYARRFKSQTKLGKFLDPFADKVFIFSTVVPLIFNNLIPFYLGGTIILRDAGILIGSLKYLRSTKYTVSKFEPTQLSKINTSVQIAYVLALITSAAFDYDFHISTTGIFEVLKMIVGSTSIATSCQYLRIYRNLIKGSS